MHQDRILSRHSDDVKKYAESTFMKKGVTLYSKHRVVEITEKEVSVENISTNERKTLPCGFCVWTAGNAKLPLIAKLSENLPSQTDQSALLTDEYLRVIGAEDVYAIGDCAAAKLPAIVPVAIQQGKYLSKSLNQISKSEQPKPFKYKHVGYMIYVGGTKVAMEIRGLSLCGGIFSWLSWKAFFLLQQASLRNRFSLLGDWLKVLLFGRNVSKH